jgi:hypothetical protein
MKPPNYKNQHDKGLLPRRMELCHPSTRIIKMTGLFCDRPLSHKHWRGGGNSVCQVNDSDYQ